MNVDLFTTIVVIVMGLSGLAIAAYLWLSDGPVFGVDNGLVR